MPLRVIYIAGPFRASTPWDQEQNVRRAEETALAVWKMGAVALCPHAMTRFYQDSAPDEIWLAGMMTLVERCDAILMTCDWRESSGSVAELETARRCGMPVWYADEMDLMADWIHERDSR